MLSRVADTIYWLARYMERTQAMLQVVRANYIASQDEPHDFSWRPLLLLYGDLPPAELQAAERDTPRVLEHLILDRQNAASAFNNIAQGRENARAVQDHITQDVWQCLNDYYHSMRDAGLTELLRHGDPVTGIDSLMKNGLLYTGAVKNTMPRDESYAYINLGKFLERAIQTADILRTKWAAIPARQQHPAEAPELRYLLHALFGYELYLKTYKGNFHPDNVLQMILYNTQFPHSLQYGLNQVGRYFERLKSESLPDSYEEVEFLIGKIRNAVRYSDFTAADPAALDAFLLQVRQQLVEVAQAFNKYYFGHS